MVGEQPEQPLLAEGRVPGPVADALQPLDGLEMEARLVKRVYDDCCFEQTLELGFSAAELVERLREDGFASSGRKKVS